MNPLSILAPFSLPYALALAAKNSAYAQGWLKQRHLQQPVVSVGNLSVGGAGKTPFVIALAQLLVQQGFEPDVLSRGYGRESRQTVERVDLGGDAARFGDEPLLMANATGLPVYVGASRYEAGLVAEQMAAPEAKTIHLLDDGFQHRALARSVDIVLLHPSDATGWLLPAGRLREPLHALTRADFLVLRDNDAITEAALRRAGIDKPIWRVRRSVAVPALAGEAFAFCGIAHPAEFFAALGIPRDRTIRSIAFRDHHRFTAGDLRRITEQAYGCDVILTTEKDFIRLTSEQRMQLVRTAPIYPVPMRVEIIDVDRCLDALIKLVRDRRTAFSQLL